MLRRPIELIHGSASAKAKRVHLLDRNQTSVHADGSFMSALMRSLIGELVFNQIKLKCIADYFRLPLCPGISFEVGECEL